jgi:hypothetical protein
MRNNTKLAAAAALAAVMAIPTAVGAQDEAAKVRVLHGVGDAPAVDVYANGEELIDALAFANITDYAEVPAGTYLIQVVPDGATIEEGPVVIEAELEFGAGTMTTVAATGTLTGEAGIIPQVVSDMPEPNAEGVQLRASHFSFDAPAVDIAPVGGEPVLTDVPFGATSDYLDLPAGPIDLEIRGAGSPDAVFTIPTLDLEAGNSYSAYAIGSFEEGTFTVIPALDASVEMMDEEMTDDSMSEDEAAAETAEATEETEG